MRYWLTAIWNSVPRSFMIVSLPFITLIVIFAGWFFLGDLFTEKPNPRHVHYAAELERLLPDANKGIKKAQYQVGVIYRDGLSGERNLAASARWFEKAAKASYPAAQFALGRAYALGQGVPQNFGRAADYYRTAAGFGRHVPSQYALGQLYFQGKGVIQDYEQAIVWYRRAALKNHAAAQAVMGSMFEKGWGINQNLVEAYVWFSLASAQPAEVIRFGLDIRPGEAAASIEKKLSRLQLQSAEKKLKSIRKKFRK